MALCLVGVLTVEVSPWPVADIVAPVDMVVDPWKKSFDDGRRRCRGWSETGGVLTVDSYRLTLKVDGFMPDRSFDRQGLTCYWTSRSIWSSNRVSNRMTMVVVMDHPVSGTGSVTWASTGCARVAVVRYRGGLLSTLKSN